MRKLSFAILFVCLGVFAAGCGGDGPAQPGASNSGGSEAETEDPTSDAGVGTDPDLMVPSGGEN